MDSSATRTRTDLDVKPYCGVRKVNYTNAAGGENSILGTPSGKRSNKTFALTFLCDNFDNAGTLPQHLAFPVPDDVVYTLHWHNNDCVLPYEAQHPDPIKMASLRHLFTLGVGKDKEEFEADMEAKKKIISEFKAEPFQKENVITSARILGFARTEEEKAEEEEKRAQQELKKKKKQEEVAAQNKADREAKEAARAALEAAAAAAAAAKPLKSKPGAGGGDSGFVVRDEDSKEKERARKRELAREVQEQKERDEERAAKRRLKEAAKEEKRLQRRSNGGKKRKNHKSNSVGDTEREQKKQKKNKKPGRPPAHLMKSKKW